MLALISVLAIITVSLAVTRVATVVLATTGLSREVARFQARSAFTGSGFTTRESESVVDHPVRRRVVMVLMLLGNAGIVTTVTSLLLSFRSASGGQTGVRVLTLLGGLVLLRLLAGSRVVDRAVTRATEWGLRRYSDLDVADYATLLHVSDRWTVTELETAAGDWLVGRPLEQLALRDEGVVVLGVQRAGGAFLGVPQLSTELAPGDRLLVYCESRGVPELSDRRQGPDGDAAHEAAVAAHRQTAPAP